MLLSEIESLDESLLTRLKKANISTSEDLILTPPAMLRRILGPTEVARLLKLLEFQNIAPYDVSKQATRRFHISTGSRRLDELLGGGVKSGRLTDFFGEGGAGKTQLCFTLSVKAGSEGRVLYVDIPGSFRPERIEEICTFRRLPVKQILENILVYRAPTVYDQERSLKSVEQNSDSKLMVIDGVADNFVVEFGEEEAFGEERALIRRQSKLTKHLWNLSRLALHHNIPVVITNSIRSRPVGKGITVELAQDVMAVCAHRRVRLFREGRFWKAVIPDLPVVVEFSIGRQGIY